MTIDHQFDLVGRLTVGIPIFDRWWTNRRTSIGFVEDAPYLDLGALASKAYEVLTHQGEDPVRNLMTRVEEVLEEDDATTRKLITVGFLEGLQNVTQGSGADVAIWDGLLGLKTMAYWDAVISLWMGTLTPASFNLTMGDATPSTGGKSSPNH